MMDPPPSPDQQVESLLTLARALAEGLRSGSETVADARRLQRLIREAEGWLLSARKFLDPSEVLDRD